MIKNYLYLIENEIGMVKIGITNNYEQRFESIRTGSGISIVKYSVFKYRFSSELEKIILEKFKDFSSNGEWFNGVLFEDIYKAIISVVPESCEESNEKIKMLQNTKYRTSKELIEMIPMLNKGEIKLMFSVLECCDNYGKVHHSKFGHSSVSHGEKIFLNKKCMDYIGMERRAFHKAKSELTNRGILKFIQSSDSDIEFCGVVFNPILIKGFSIPKEVFIMFRNEIKKNSPLEYKFYMEKYGYKEEYFILKNFENTCEDD